MPNDHDQPLPPERSKKLVLVVDDDTDVRETISEYLTAQGFGVIEAPNGLEALLHVKRARPAGVVLDLFMPRLGGLDTLKRIHTFDPNIMVVAVTGRADPELRSRALAGGAAAVLTKPVGLAELATILEGPDQSVADESSERKPVQAESAAPVAGRVLVVDDDPEIHEMLTEFLARHGYETRSVMDGAAAVRAVLDDAPNVVLLDVAMPRLGGLEALAALRAIAPAVQVIMLSGQTDVELAKRTLSFGAFDYIAKPVDFAYLAESVGAAVAMNRMSSPTEEDSTR